MPQMQIKRCNDGSETWNAGTRLCSSAEIKYLVLDPANKQAAIDGVLDEAPEVYGGLPLRDIRFEGYTSGGDIEICAVYSRSDNSNSSNDQEDEAPTVNFDCSGGSKRLTWGLSRQRRYPETAQDAGGAIGWNGEEGDKSEVAGVEIPSGQMRETYTKNMPVGRLSTGYKRTCAALVGKVNSHSFKGWDPGEVMFLGMSYTAPSRGAKYVTVAYNFMIQSNERNVKIGGISVERKLGFEYIWAISKTKAQAGSSPKLEVKGVYVDQVCEYANFSALGI